MYNRVCLWIQDHLYIFVVSLMQGTFITKSSLHLYNDCTAFLLSLVYPQYLFYITKYNWFNECSSCLMPSAFQCVAPSYNGLVQWTS